MSEKQQRLVYSIIEFLNQSIEDGTVKEDDREGLEVAIQCIGEAFNVDPSDQHQADKFSVKPTTLLNIFDVFLKTRDKVAPASKPKDPTPEDKAQAATLKQTGNQLMSANKYKEAVATYTQCIALDPTNPVYYSNRAAAHSSTGDHTLAIADAEKGIAIDPKFLRLYNRLGHAYHCIGDFDQACVAYERGLEIDPQNESFTSGLRASQSRVKSEAERSAADVRTPASSSSSSAGLGAGGMGGMADILRSMGGGGGGMPDIASMMRDPQMMAMAQQMAANGGLANLMQNPTVANMMNRAQNGELPSMDEIMNDPSLQDLMSQYAPGARP